MVEDVDLVETEEVIKEVLSNEKEMTSHLNDEEIELITEKVMDKITEKLKLLTPSSENAEKYLEILEPKTKVINQYEFSVGVKIFGYILLGLCIGYWIYNFFIIGDIVSLTHTTYLTMILISLTCINKFESVLLNSFTSISSIGFLLISIFLINSTKDIYTALGGPILHGLMAAFQLYLVINKKIPVSKRYLIIGYLFYIFFLSSYDSFGRLIDITETGTIFSEIMVLVQTFYIFSLSTILIYYIKKKYGMLLP
ncbi:MAG: hypothetical protein ACTSQD_07400 [Promethearchaeota archaeon]